MVWVHQKWSVLDLELRVVHLGPNSSRSLVLVPLCVVLLDRLSQSVCGT